MTKKIKHSDEDPVLSDDTPADPQRRHFLKTASGVLAGLGGVCALTPLLGSWMPSSHTHRQSLPVRVDLRSMQPGDFLTVEWSGKPIFILRRTQAMLAQLEDENHVLRDPHSKVQQQPLYAQNTHRSLRAEYLVLIGLCTHLGCIPQFKRETTLDHAGQEGFYCPCHGSRFDLAGRVFKHVPAPINLAVPPHHFVDDYTLVIGESA